ncbi:MAG: protein-disulfide reductase DsbD [Bacteroidetes bacterium]|nr:protein-disulfide reductase DsbD [Bacteroidota bacterium]MBU1799061.1 protein-disulfide reductase DsbD [Bacteroidota bacterium]
MKKHLTILALFLFLASNILAQFGLTTQYVSTKVFSSFDKVQPNSEIKIAIELNILEQYHINSNKPKDEFLIPTELIIKSKNVSIVSITYPKAKDVSFSFSDELVSVYEGKEFIGAVLKISDSVNVGIMEIPIEISYQACNDASCMAPTSVLDTLRVEVVNNTTPINEVNQEIFSNLNISYTPVQTTIEKNDDGIASTLESSGLLLSILFVFLGGLALNLTPCVYPLIPITIGYFGGQSEGKTSKLFVLGVLYVLGMALTYSVVGVVTAMSGAIFGTLLQNPIVIIVIAAIFVVLALSMFGLYEIKAPDSLITKAGGARTGIFGAFFMGLTMGIVAAPCIGPFVLGLVTYVAAKGDVFYGFIMFFFLAVGLGVPYLFLAIFSGRIKSLPRAGFWMEGVRNIFGFILIGMAIYFVNPILPKIIANYLLPVFMIGASIYLLFIDKLANNLTGYRIFKSIFSVLMIVIATWMLWPVEKSAPNWEKYSTENYETALQNNNKIIIDFYADWCIPCKELDALTFSDAKVISALANFKSLKVDMTKSLSKETEIIREKFNIVGMPTILLIDSKGNEVERLTGFMNAKEFLEMVKKVN